MDKFGKEGILDRLTQLDDDLLSCIDNGRNVEITIVGGSALVLLELSAESRMTTDIDVMEAALQAEALLERYDMNQHATTFRFRLPENWRGRRQRVPFDGVVLEVYAPSNEDLAILKLDAYRPIDQADLKEMVNSGRLDINKLLAIVHDDVEIRVGFDDDAEWFT
ncbi:MAG: hypothetical protein LBO74_01420, partial [Candidatus Symbiothrix sp.]|nr:hypothetical protein [Candidatus Symbiothrix sp.]